MNIIKTPLNEGQYFKEIHKKKTIYLHHTAGGPDARNVIHGWNTDTQGQIGTAYVISANGEIHEAFDPKYWAYHLGLKTSNNKLLNQESIGIEICNYGYLEMMPDGRFKTYVGSFLDESQVCDLGYEWRGHRYWQRYTEAQLVSVTKLVIKLYKEFGINILRGLPEMLLTGESTAPTCFDLNASALSGLAGLWTHCNVRADKFDCYPSPELIEMLLQL